MVSGVDSKRPIGPHKVPQKIADRIRARGLTPVELAEQQRLDDLADDHVEGDDASQHEQGHQPARQDGEGDDRGQHGAEDGADIRHEAQRAREQPPQQGVGHAESEQAQPDQDGEAEIGEKLQGQDPRDARGGIAQRLGRRVHVAGAEQPHELVAEMVAIGQDEDNQNDDDAQAEQGVEKRRHKARDAGKARHAALHMNGGHRGRPGIEAEVVGQRGHHRHESADGAAALRQSLHVLDLLMEVGLIEGEAASHVGELGEHQDRDDAAHDQAAGHDHADRQRKRQEAPDPGERRAEDECEKHRERRRDEHVTAEIKRQDRDRPQQGDGGATDHREI